VASEVERVIAKQREAEALLDVSAKRLREAEDTIKGKEEEIEALKTEAVAAKDLLQKREANLSRSENIIKKLMADVEELKRG
jgi:chromosome segregation ATPase